jgi:hypothetical protein
LSEEQESIEAAIAARERESAAIARLNRGLGGLNTVLGNVLRGAPQGLSTFADGLSSGLSQALQGADAYVGVWRDLTTRGVNFGNELDNMITTVGAANLQMEKFVNIVDQYSNFLAGSAITTDQGAQQFLSQLTSFVRKGSDGFDPLFLELEKLGMGVNEVAERIVEYNALTSILGFRERRTENERNRGMAEYAKNLDKLSKLTGIQSDELARQQREISMQGDVFAFTQMIDEEVRDELTSTLGVFRTMGPEMERYATQMLTRGFIDPDDPAMVQIQRSMPDLRDALVDMRGHLLGNNETLASMSSDMAITAASGIRENQILLRDAMLGGVTEYTSAAVTLLTNSSSSALALSASAIRDQLREERGLSDDAFISNADVLATREEMLRKLTESQTEPGGQGQQVLEEIQSLLREGREVAVVAQEETVNLIFGSISGAARTLRNNLDSINLAGGLQDILSDLRGWASGVTDIDPAGDALTRAAQNRQAELNAIAAMIQDTDRAGADALLETSAALANAASDFDPEDQSTRTQIQMLLEQSRVMLESRSQLLRVDTDRVSIIADFVDLITGGDGHATGTLGTTGKLFKDFGTETLTPLHGIESVTTPEQMASIVEHSALGAMRATMQSVMASGFTNNSSSLDGMLNTIRNIPAQMSDQMQQTTGTSELENAMSRLASQMRVPLEEALNNTLVPRMEQLVQVNTRNADTSDKIKKGIGSIGSDMLRSV